jgi:hypothetical protein
MKFENFAERMISAIVKRIVVSNIGLKMGGMTSKVFIAAKEINQINNIEEQRKSEMAGVMMNKVDPVALKNALSSFVFTQGIGAGMIGGFMMDGKLSSGLRYSYILGMISLFVFKFVF